MSIRFDEGRKLFLLETKNTSYQMTVDPTGCLRHLYYGPRVYGTDMGYRYRTSDRGFSGNPYAFSAERGCSFDVMPQEYPTAGAGHYRESALRVRSAMGTSITQLVYDSYEIQAGRCPLKGLPYVRTQEEEATEQSEGEMGREADTLLIHLKDPYLGLEVTLAYVVFAEKDVIARNAVIRNHSTEKVTLLQAASLCLDLPCGKHDLVYFTGKHCMERQVQRQSLGQCVVTVGSKRGMSSHHNNPFVILCDPSATEDTGGCYGSMLLYSGNHKESVETDQTLCTRLVAGIHDEGFSWLLEPGDSFQTPEGILAYSKEGFHGLSQILHRIIRENIIPARFRRKNRPILLNSWEACYFDFNQDSLYRLAKEAKELGAQMLVLDDGWFGQRNDDHRGLGDWFVNETKIQGGLGALSEKIHGLGLQFGLWFEPEMVNEDSELYRLHPDWALQEPGRPPVLARNQLVLDLSRREVQDYLYDCISSLVEEAKLDYIKWDFNRSVSDVCSHGLGKERQGEVLHRFVLGTYSLLERLRKAFPDLLIEGCAGGGGRFDAGMLFYTPQIWCSDNTDPIARLKIQWGTSYGYPAYTMGSHISASPNHQTLRSTPLSTRGLVASWGVLGLELDPATLSEEEKEEVRQCIKAYERNEALVREGTFFRLEDGASSGRVTAWSFVAEDQSEALVAAVCTEVEANAPFPWIKLKGLKEEALYALQGTSLVASGAALMYGGYVLEQFRGDYPAVELLFQECRTEE